MKIITGNMFSKHILKFADALCVTTNGILKKNNAAVMGAGNAKAVRDRYKGIDFIFGELIKKNGNIVQIIDYRDNLPIVAFPVKHNWREKADPKLLELSAFQLTELTNTNKWKKVILPKPGVDNGKLSWLKTVKPILNVYLDDRFYIIGL